jgi:hypothetical protein
MRITSGLRGKFAVAGLALCLVVATGTTAAGGTTTASPTWRVSHVFAGQPLADLLAVTATGPGDAWAFGDGKNARPAAVHWNGKTWSQSYLPGATDRPEQVSETGRTNVWAAGGGCGQVSTTAYVSRWNGSKWTTTLFPKTPFCGASAVVTTGPSDGWLFNESGSPAVALHFTGKTWKNVSLGKVGTVLSASAVSQKNMWAATYTLKNQMLVVHWNGSSWRTVPIPAAPVPKGDDTVPIQLVAAGTSNIWLTTVITRNNMEVPGPLRSLVLHWNGTGWHWIKVPYADLALQAASDGHGGMWANAMINSPSSAYDFVHYSGGKWTRQPAPTAGIPATVGTVDVFSLALIPGTQTLWASGDAFWDPSPTTSASASVMFKYGP